MGKMVSVGRIIVEMLSRLQRCTEVYAKGNTRQTLITNVYMSSLQGQATYMKLEGSSLISFSNFCVGALHPRPVDTII